MIGKYTIPGSGTTPLGGEGGGGAKAEETGPMPYEKKKEKKNTEIVKGKRGKRDE
jgi:hypothetical protein